MLSPAYRPLPPYPSHVLDEFEAVHAPFLFDEDFRKYLTTVSREFFINLDGQHVVSFMHATCQLHVVPQARSVVPLYTAYKPYEKKKLVALPVENVPFRCLDVFDVTSPPLADERAFAAALPDSTEVVRAEDAARRVSLAYGVSLMTGMEYWRVWAESHHKLVHEDDVQFLDVSPLPYDDPDRTGASDCNKCFAVAVEKHCQAVLKSSYSDDIEKLEAKAKLHWSKTTDYCMYDVPPAAATDEDLSKYLTIQDDMYGMGLRLCVFSGNPARIGSFVDSQYSGGVAFEFYVPSFALVHKLSVGAGGPRSCLVPLV